jgi:hypothetical protein
MAEQPQCSKDGSDGTQDRDLRRATAVPLFDPDLTPLDRLDLSRPHSTPPDSNRQVRSHGGRCLVIRQETKYAAVQVFSMERAGLEPATSGLQTHPIARPHLTPTDRIGMTKRYLAISSNVT